MNPTCECELRSNGVIRLSSESRSDGSDHSKKKILRWLYICVSHDFSVYHSKIRQTVMTGSEMPFHEVACIEVACEK